MLDSSASGATPWSSNCCKYLRCCSLFRMLGDRSAFSLFLMPEWLARSRKVQARANQALRWA